MRALSIILLILIFFSTHAVAADSNDDKYHFANLEEVRSFLNWQITGWQAIDSRSLIIEVPGAVSYLLILDRDLQALMYTDQIKFSSTRGNRVRVNIDQIQVFDEYARPSRITTIYRLPNREAHQNARAKILSEEPEALEIGGEVL